MYKIYAPPNDNIPTVQDYFVKFCINHSYQSDISWREKWRFTSAPFLCTENYSQYKIVIVYLYMSIITLVYKTMSWSFMEEIKNIFLMLELWLNWYRRCAALVNTKMHKKRRHEAVILSIYVHVTHNLFVFILIILLKVNFTLCGR